MALTLSTKAKIAAATLTALSAMGGAFSVSAQQMAANTSPAATTMPTADFLKCDAIKEPARSAQCYQDTKIAYFKERTAAADVRGAAAGKRIAAVDDSIACAKFLVSKKAAGVTLDPTRLNREKGCVYARELGMQ